MKSPSIVRVPGQLTSEAFSGDGRNSAPNTHGSPEAVDRVRHAIEAGLGSSALSTESVIEPINSDSEVKEQ